MKDLLVKVSLLGKAPALRQKVFSFLVYKYNKFPLKERQSRGTYQLFFTILKQILRF